MYMYMTKMLRLLRMSWDYMYAIIVMAKVETRGLCWSD